MGTMTSTTRKAVRSVRLSPGTSVDVGPYRLTADPDARRLLGRDHRGARAARPRTWRRNSVAREPQLTLASLAPAEALGARSGSSPLLAIVFFLLPAGRVLDLPWRQPEHVAIASDRFWNPGPVMLAHQPIGGEVRGLPRGRLPARARRRLPRMPLARSASHVAAGHEARRALRRHRAAPQCHRDHKGVKSTHPRRRPLLRRHAIATCARRRTARSRGTWPISPRDHPAFRLTPARRQGRAARAPGERRRSRRPRTSSSRTRSTSTRPACGTRTRAR